MIGAAVEGAHRDMVAGWGAPLGLLGVGALVALAVVLAATTILNLALTLPAGVTTVVAGMVQAAVTFAVAGRLMKKEGLR